jgi:site-specific DNA-methyltransferase (adenine-specific)
MKPYYQHAGITIFCGDCREILPELPKCDLLLTDPPYGMSWDGKVTRGKNGTGSEGPTRHYGTTITGDDEPFDPSFLLDFPGVILWGFNHFPQHLSKGTALVWLKRYDDGFQSFLSDAEIAWMNKGCGVYCRRDVSMQGESTNRVHPAQKPISLMKWCLSFFPDAKTVLDPFCGSGTTLVAAKAMGLTAVGIELHEPYAEIAAKRLSQEVFDFA